MEVIMKVTNNTSFTLIAFGWFQSKGYGDDVSISPGQTADVNGPYLGEMGGGHCHIALPGGITCHEGPDSEDRFHVSQGEPLNLADGDRGVTVRHQADQPEPYVTQWRSRCKAPSKDEEMAEAFRVAIQGHSDRFRIESTSKK